MLKNCASVEFLETRSVETPFREVPCLLIGDGGWIDSTLFGNDIAKRCRVVATDSVEVYSKDESGPHERRRMASLARGANVPKAVDDHRNVAA